MSLMSRYMQHNRYTSVMLHFAICILLTSETEVTVLQNNIQLQSTLMMMITMMTIMIIIMITSFKMTQEVLG